VFGIFQAKPVLDHVARQWLLDAYAWALSNFNAQVFFKQTPLVLPTNEHFPGRGSSVEEMAGLILEQVKTHSGVKNWPCRLYDATQAMPATTPRLVLQGPPRTPGTDIAIADADALVIPYNPHQVSKPQALIASYAYVLAYYMGTAAQQPPPGGESYWPHATELLGVFMGFGIMFANTAYTFRGGCGSCYNPLAERSAVLSQDEVTYALAIFCALKGIGNDTVLPHLKSYLRPVYKKAAKELHAERERLAALSVLSR
jgi:hypothetical protein